MTRNSANPGARSSRAGKQARGRAVAPGRAGASGKAARKAVGARIPLFRPSIRRRQMHAVLECLVSEEIGPGPIAKQLTAELAAALGCRGGVALADHGAAAAAALHLATESAPAAEQLPAAGPQPILLSALVSLSYVYVARAAGLHPLLVDVDPETGSLDGGALQRMLAHRPRALVVGHPLASSEPLDEVRAAGVPIVEDVSATLLAMVTERAGAAGGSAGAARDARVNAAANGAADQSAAGAPDPPAPRAPAGDVLVIGLQAPGALAAGGGGLVLARSPRGRRLLAGYGSRFGWAQLADMNAALALAQWRDLTAGRERCAELAAHFRDAVARSRHRTLAAAAAGPLFPVVVEDGLRAVQRYASRHRVETMLACEGSAITGVLPVEEDPADGDRAAAGPPAAAPAEAKPAAAEEAAAAAVEERLDGAQELARRCLLFPLYPELPDSQAGQVSRVLATLP